MHGHKKEKHVLVKEEIQEHGHKKGKHVPVKEEIEGARSQEGETFARERGNRGCTVTRRVNVCP